jgi:hypothetical protein
MNLTAPSLTATTSSAPCLLEVNSARIVVLLASTASEGAVDVGSAVCMMAEGARSVWRMGSDEVRGRGGGARGGGGRGQLK